MERSIGKERIDLESIQHELTSDYTVQAIRNITNFRAKNPYKFVQIRKNFVLKFVHEIRKKFVQEFVREFLYEFMPQDYVFKEKIWGKYQYY